MPSGFTTARTMRKKTPVFRTTSSMAFSQLLGLQERVEEIGESGDGEDEAEGGFERHGVSLFSFDSDLVAALHVPERQREEAERQEEEKGVEHEFPFGGSLKSRRSRWRRYIPPLTQK